MSNRHFFNSVLIPTDFSVASQLAFQWGLRSVDGEEPTIIALHVLDENIVQTVAEHEFATREEVVRRMRAQAEKQFADYKDTTGRDVEIEPIVAEGIPFLEILRKADDFAVDAIVMGIVGIRGGVEQMLFGSTVDKVLRGARHPVVVLPEMETTL